MTTSTAYDTLTAMFSCDYTGLFPAFDVELFAERLGVTTDEVDDLLIDMEHAGLVRDELDGLYDAAKADEYEAECEAEDEAERESERLTQIIASRYWDE